MTARALAHARVLTPAGFIEDGAVVIEAGRISAVVAVDALPPGMPAEDLGGLDLVPGFIDSQVNGGGGVLFNDDPSVAAIETIAIAHRRFGTTGFLPTLISDDLEVVKRGIAAIDDAMNAGIPGVLGIHIEGPFLNRARKGIHDADKIRSLDEHGRTLISSLKQGRTLVTLAPECTTGQMIQDLANAGLIVAAGHTNGTYDEISNALGNGLSGFTHLFNAMSPLASRDAGAVGAALYDPNAWCGIIVDGKHVSPVTLQIAMRCKAIDRFMLVTDAMPSVGSPEKQFVLQGQLVQVIDGVCVNEDGTLAGSDLDMAQAIRNSVDMLGVDLQTALEMASLHPASFLRLDHELGSIAPGKRADLNLLARDGTVQASWIGGER